MHICVVYHSKSLQRVYCGIFWQHFLVKIQKCETKARLRKYVRIKYDREKYKEKMRYDSYFVRIRICKRFEIRSPRDFPGILKEKH